MKINYKSYLKNPNQCPFCHSDDITGHEADFSDIISCRKISCNSCNKTWQEEFTITSVKSYNKNGELE